MICLEHLAATTSGYTAARAGKTTVHSVFSKALAFAAACWAALGHVRPWNHPFTQGLSGASHRPFLPCREERTQSASQAIPWSSWASKMYGYPSKRILHPIIAQRSPEIKNKENEGKKKRREWWNPAILTNYQFVTTIFHLAEGSSNPKCSQASVAPSLSLHCLSTPDPESLCSRVLCMTFVSSIWARLGSGVRRVRKETKGKVYIPSPAPHPSLACSKGKARTWLMSSRDAWCTSRQAGQLGGPGDRVQGHRGHSPSPWKTAVTPSPGSIGNMWSRPGQVLEFLW